MNATVLSVPDISCAHCRTAIEGAVGALPGVTLVAVDVTGKRVTIEGTVAEDTVEETLRDLGYEVAGRA